MAAPGTFDLDLYQGDTAAYRLTLTRTSADGVEAPVDLTGATGLAQIRKNVRDANVLATLEVTFPDPVNGKVLLQLPADESIKAGNGVWDLQVTEADGTVKTWLRGAVTIDAGVSR